MFSRPGAGDRDIIDADAITLSPEVSGLTLLPPDSDLALKEWAVAVNVMGRGDQILMLRKGGIHRDDKEFRVVHPEFLLYPTYEHQKADLLKESAHEELQRSLDEDDITGLVSLTYWCQVTDKFQIADEDVVDTLSPHHIWTSDYAQKRLHWRPKQPLTVALVRVYGLQQPQALPVLDEYVGCKSWVELGQDVPLGYMEPVLSDEAYDEKAEVIRRALAGTPSPV